MGVQLSQIAFKMIMSNRCRFLLVLEKSKGTKYENFKIELIEELKGHIQSQMNSKIQNKELLAHVFAKGLIEGIIIIAKEYKDTEQLKHNLECLMNYHADGCLLHNRITQSCKVKMDKVASPFWTKLQTLVQGLSGTVQRLRGSH